MKRLTAAKLQKLHDKLVKELTALQQEFAAFQHAIDALQSEQRKPKRAKK